MIVGDDEAGATLTAAFLRGERQDIPS